ncbi:ATP/GTP-binding protein [Streptomyces sp. CB02414]|uniref:ATP/GTP-binding protein n=1 Tax=Streptomyces sp. CB02414 TaxID=1703922 RepID=UPI00093E2D67|nr:ATP/GTP-binding protein [Streptomyces sp. CB02414]OKI77825.1 ATP/GTP-binding protein [Streptomyces sp. CB02414]
MDSDGMRDARGTRRAVPRPASGPPPMPQGPPSVAPPAERAPQASPSLAAWLDAPRPDAATGVWRFGHVPPKLATRRPKLAPASVAGAAIPLVIGIVLWSMWVQGVFPYKTVLVGLVTPDDWWYPGTLWPVDSVWQARYALMAIDNTVFVLLLCTMGYLGSWPTLVRHWLGRWQQPTRAAATAAGAVLGLLLVFPVFDSDPLPVYTTVVVVIALLNGGWDVLGSPVAMFLVDACITLAVVVPCARWGDWLPLFRQWQAARRAGPRPKDEPAATAPPSQWPLLRAAGNTHEADLLTAEVLTGRMNDVDCARVRRAWDVLRGEGRLATFTDTVRRHGAAAWTHPSGCRDLPLRTSTHDLLAGQVRIGRCGTEEGTPAPYRGAGVALDLAALGTSLLAVGPPESGRSERLTAPVVESLALEALTGACALVAVSGPGRPAGPDGAFDVVISPGDPASPYDLHLYGETTDPDDAAAVLAECLVGDLQGFDTGRAATVLAQLLGPYQAAHGHFPAVPALRELLEGRPEAVSALLEALPPEEAPTLRRELDPWVRRTGTALDVGSVLADRLSRLDRPAFRDFLGVGAAEAGEDTERPFSLRALRHHPLRVRIDLPGHGHDEAAQMLARLVLAQFLAVARSSGDRPHFVCLVLDDASGAVTPGTVRAVQRLRSDNAGVVLGLRSLSEVPEALHGPLLGAVGCRAVFSGVTTWDGRAFAEAWGTEWVETTEVAQHTVFADQPITRAMHALRKLVTGKAVTTEAVTVRQVERERWSASELAHAVPAGHAVLSLTSVKGEHTPPLLVDLRG